MDMASDELGVALLLLVGEVLDRRRGVRAGVEALLGVRPVRDPTFFFAEVVLQ